MADEEPLSKRHKLIEGNLKHLFEEDTAEEMPDRFREMIERLRKSSGKPNDESGDEK